MNLKDITWIWWPVSPHDIPIPHTWIARHFWCQNISTRSKDKKIFFILFILCTEVSQVYFTHKPPSMTDIVAAARLCVDSTYKQVYKAFTISKPLVRWWWNNSTTSMSYNFNKHESIECDMKKITWNKSKAVWNFCENSFVPKIHLFWWHHLSLSLSWKRMKR